MTPESPLVTHLSAYRFAFTAAPCVHSEYAARMKEKKDELVRFGIAMESSLLSALDELVKKRQGTRSEVLRDLARAEVRRAQISEDADGVGALTIIYDHHVRDLGEKLTDLQHSLGDTVRATLHVHLDHDRCLEIIVLRGHAAQLQSVSDRIIATRGVIDGELSVFTDVPHKSVWKRGHTHAGGHSHDHVHDHDHEHDDSHGSDHGHDQAAGHDHGHTHPPVRAAKRKAGPAKKVPAKK